MNWQLKSSPDQDKVIQLSKVLGVTHLIASLLIQRQVDSFEKAKSFFRPSWDQLHDPFLMQDMQIAVDRIDQAQKQGEKIMVFGDYDVDGTTSVALMTTFLKNYFSRVIPYIPDRYKEGYGISIRGIEEAKSRGVKLIIALDCGIKALKQVEYAKGLGIDFIICDHHLPGDQLPEAVAVLDPKRKDCAYPFKELCGCGIGFKLIQALNIHWNTKKTLLPYLDLVATAIAADIVPLVDENRVLCFLGLEQLNSNPRPGFKTILKELKKPAKVSDLVFRIAPRINAAGRMDHAIKAVDLLINTDLDQVQSIAQQIEGFNLERKIADEQITKEALEQIHLRKEENFPATIVYHDQWHKGVVGIVASRIIESFYRPTVVMTRSGDNYVGSARSVKGFDVYQALLACQDHLIQFGGHKYAAGLTVCQSKMKSFKAAFERRVSEQILPEQKTPSMYYDAEVELQELDHKTYRILSQMSPFGPLNLRPVFCTHGCIDAGGSSLVGKEKEHLRLVLKTSSKPFIGIAFNQSEHFDLIKKGQPFSILYTLEENTWNQNTSLQLKIKDIQITL